MDENQNNDAIQDMVANADNKATNQQSTCQNTKYNNKAHAPTTIIKHILQIQNT